MAIFPSSCSPRPASFLSSPIRNPTMFKPPRALQLALLSVLASSPEARAAPDCFASAASYQHVSPLVLRAIAWQESHGKATAIHRNTNGSTDYGMMQINSVHLPTLAHYGVSQQDLMNPCSSVYVAAWRLHKMMVKYGNTWAAVGAYHSETPAERDRYAHSIKSLVLRLSNVPPALDE
ncbi:lytic transglycosylase domain-containing protein [Paraburkholderia sp. Ac-20336]|nr:lytic transglycosylase domain-containing protein [Paraburkholderia sp. Ac-20336]